MKKRVKKIYKTLVCTSLCKNYSLKTTNDEVSILITCHVSWPPYSFTEHVASELFRHRENAAVSLARIATIKPSLSRRRGKFCAIADRAVVSREGGRRFSFQASLSVA
jgi:hypothetical protein